MTTVVCSRKSIACDLQGTGGGQRFKLKTKVEHFEDGIPAYPHLGECYVGFAGNVSEWIECLDWFLDPKGKMPKNSISLLILTKKGKIYTSGNNAGTLMELDEPFQAIGSGAQAALGAMHVGATTAEAVKAAGKVDPMTGLGVKEYSFV